MLTFFNASALIRPNCVRPARRLGISPLSLLQTNPSCHRYGSSRPFHPLAAESTLGMTTMCSAVGPLSRRWLGNIPSDDDTTQSDRKRREQKTSAAPGDDSFAPSRAVFLGQILPFVGNAVCVFAGLAALGMGLLYVKQDSLLYIPEIEGISRHNGSNPPGYRSPAEYRGIPFETNFIETTGAVSIHSWLLLHPNSKEKEVPTIVFFHGNAGNIGIRIPNAVQLYNNLEANVLLVEYRGYGESKPESVKPSESGIKSDSEAVLRFIVNHPKVDPSLIFIFGRSLGGSVGFHVARFAEENDIPVAGLIVENAFVSVGRMVDALLPFLSPFKGLLLRNKWDCGKLAPTLKVPILYLAGERDEIVPHAHMKELYASSKKSSCCARIHVVEDGTHNETWLQGGQAYWNAMKAFLREAPNAGMKET